MSTTMDFLGDLHKDETRKAHAFIYFSIITVHSSLSQLYFIVNPTSSFCMCLYIYISLSLSIRNSMGLFKSIVCFADYVLLELQ